MELTKKQEEWRPHVEAAAAFDGSAADYARLHSLDLKKLYFYKRSIEQRKTTQQVAGFVRARPAARSLASEVGVHVQLPNGVRLLVPDLSDSDLLERLSRL